MSAITFTYEILDEVMIRPLELRGIVFARCDQGNFLEYRVTYWCDGKRVSEWLVESELEPAK